MVNPGPSTHHEPPRRIMRFLRWFCADSFLEEIEGDLFELFQEEVADYGLPKARRRFLFTSMRYVRPYFFGKKQLSLYPYFNPAMLKHYLKISFRHLFRQKFYSAINITGFAVGLACCLMILFFIKHELSYDRFFPQSERVYQVVIDYSRGDQTVKFAWVTTPLTGTLLQEFPEIEQATRIAPALEEAGSNLVRMEGAEQNTYEEGFLYVDPSFLEIFEFPVVYGDLPKALEEPFTVVMTKSKAERFFPKQNPLGKTLILNNNTEQPFRITGVIEDLPSNTHLQFDYLLSMEGVPVTKIPNWGYSNFMAYVKLRPGTSEQDLEAKLPLIVDKYLPNVKEQFSEHEYYRFILQPLTDIHLGSSDIRGYWVHGNVQYVWLFGIIALFILVIACINFMNLSTARSANRAKEVGLRKVLGSFRRQLAGQFLTESVIVSLLAFTFAVALVQLSLPYFNDLTGKTLTFPWNDYGFLAMLLAATIVVGLLAGAYPAGFLSSFRPMQILRGEMSKGSKGGRFRSALVVFQFTISIVLIISSLVVRQQIAFIQNRNLGFEKDQVVIVEDTYTLNNQILSFKEQLKNLPSVSGVSVSGFIPVSGYNRNNTSAWRTGENPEEADASLAKWFVDHDYIKTMGMEIVAGRDFSIDHPTDSSAIIINEKAVEILGLKNPIGERISSYTGIDPETGKLFISTYTVIGVVKDFNYESMKENIEGLSLTIGQSTNATILKVGTDDVPQLIGQIEDVWDSFAPNQPFRYHFLDERFAAMYAFEQKAGAIFTIFTSLAILVACLGLFALATFMAEQRSKEISIRKVLGASVHDITVMLTKNFALLVIIAIIIAAPIAWYFMNNWLQDFEYRTTIGWPVFLVAGALALIIALLTISFQAIRAAVANPAERLRSE